MLDIKFIRENPEKVKEGCQKKGVRVDVDRILEIDKKKRETITALEDMRAKKNKASKDIAEAKSEQGKKKIIMEMKELDKGNDRLEKSLKDLDEEFRSLLSVIPNLPLDDVPVGKSEKENVVLEEIGEKTKFDFQPKDYMEIGEKLDLIDIKRAAKTSGTRFGFIKKEAALLEFAIVNFAIEKLVKRGFVLVIPPVMIKTEMARGMGFLEQADANEAYYLPQDDLYLVGTAEQPLGTMHAGETFEEKDLPCRYIGFSTCFRREAGSYGKDTKGIFRVHQFDKVEMFSFCRPEDSQKEHKFFLETEKELMSELKIPYRVLQMCTGDLGFPTASKYDIEAWIPSENRYRETHSTSNCTDFQARRLSIRHKKKKGGLDFVHTINGTAFAVGRTLIAIIENYQQKDGSLKVPAALQKYLTFKELK
jgi:seryl-tRNA synthetase